MLPAAAGRVRVGTSGWRYPRRRGDFQPPRPVQRREPEHPSRRMTSVEINGTSCSLQRPESVAARAEQTPEDFLFAVKGPRFVTHLEQSRDVRVPVANVLAPGVLAPGPALGPLLRQLPPRVRFDAARLGALLELLPRTTGAAAALAALAARLGAEPPDRPRR